MYPLLKLLLSCAFCSSRTYTRLDLDRDLEDPVGMFVSVGGRSETVFLKFQN